MLRPLFYVPIPAGGSQLHDWYHVLYLLVQKMSYSALPFQHMALGHNGNNIYMYLGYCQEIGLVALMFFFELLFSYVSLAISFYVSFTNLFSIILFLIC